MAADERLRVCADAGAIWTRMIPEAIAKNFKKDTALLFRPADEFCRRLDRSAANARNGSVVGLKL